jgi:hypothetical protein
MEPTVTPHQVPSQGSRATGGPAPISLPDLARRIAALWIDEPQASRLVREELLRELHDLDHTVERLLVRRSAGHPIPAHHVRHVSARYLRLREQWPEGEAAA